MAGSAFSLLFVFPPAVEGLDVISWLLEGDPAIRWQVMRDLDDALAANVPNMPSVIKSVSFDAADALALARFWAAALGSDVDEDSTPGRAYLEAAGWGGPNIWFNQVPEPKTAKNRVHFDLRAPGTVEEEVARLERLGATVIRRRAHHTEMADPEGNEFCVEPGPA